LWPISPPAATGSDTGGSIRIPAAFCGCVGFKPTFGVLGTAGLLGACPTFDHAGFLARTVEDVSLLLGAGVDADRDSSAVRRPSAAFAGQGQVRGLRIGIPYVLDRNGYFLDHLDDEVARAFVQAIDRCREAGASVRSVSLPVDEDTVARVFDPTSSRDSAPTTPRRETPGKFR
jgi:aspartyl-tRNA(Asn)/glutamyl-tRNA(Gln) amidotransferase subunit A